VASLMPKATPPDQPSPPAPLVSQNPRSPRLQLLSHAYKVTHGFSGATGVLGNDFADAAR